MKKPVLAAVVMALVPALASLAHAEGASDPVKTELTPAPSSSLAASASASVEVPTDTAKDVFTAGEKSALPKIAEWKTAAKVTVVDGDSRCTSVHVREWLRVRCHVPGIMNVSLLGGTRDNTFLGVTQTNKDDFFGDTTADIIIPMRVGDRREIQVVGAQGGGYGGMFTPDPEVLLTEYWLAADQPPVLLIHTV